MQRIESRIDVHSETFLRQQEELTQLVAELRERQRQAREVRPPRDLERIRRQGKLLPRERLELLLDPGTPFLEFSSLAGGMHHGGEAPSAGQLTGLGIVNGREVIVRADDATVKGGAWYPLSIKKFVRALDIAVENRLPVVHLCDSAGGFLPLQHEMFADRYQAGRIFRNQCKLASLGVPQVALVAGHCTAGGAYVPALSDYSVMVEGQGAIFLGGPPLVKAATGETVTAEALGGAKLHTSRSGTADYSAPSEPAAIDLVRELVAQFPLPRKTTIDTAAPEPPHYDPRELYGIVPCNIRQQFDAREVIARLVDGSRFHEYQPAYGTTLICGYARLWGHRVGILANNGVLFNDSTLKGAHFITLCNQSRVPLLFLQNITGFMVGEAYEARGITKDGAKMIMAVSNSTVPKLTLILGGSFGAGNYGMCGRAFDPRFLFLWPQAQISVMGAEQAANVLSEIKVKQLQRQGERLSPEALQAIREPIYRDYADHGSSWYSSSALWDDGVLDPLDSRDALGMALSATLNAPIPETPPHYGVFRL